MCFLVGKLLKKTTNGHLVLSVEHSILDKRNGFWLAKPVWIVDWCHGLLFDLVGPTLFHIPREVDFFRRGKVRSKVSRSCMGLALSDIVWIYCNQLTTRYGAYNTLKVPSWNHGREHPPWYQWQWQQKNPSLPWQWLPEGNHSIQRNTGWCPPVVSWFINLP